MEKNMLEQYKAAQKRIDILKMSIKNIEDRKSKMDEKGYFVTDVVNRGKRGKKTIGTVKISGFPHETYKKISEGLEQRKKRLLEEEEKLVELTGKVEEYISEIKDIEMRSILTLYYIEDLTWIQVAHKMNEGRGKKEYTEDSCRCKRDRFIEKNF